MINTKGIHGEVLSTFPDGRPIPQFLTPREVAGWLNISPEVVYLAIRSGELPCRKFTARQFRVQREAVLDWFHSQAES